MSTIDPDARARALGARLQFLALPACLVGILVGPVIAILYWAAGTPADLGAAAIIGYVLISVGAGLLIYYLPNRPGPLAIAAYSFAYVGGLFAVMASGSINDPTVPAASYLLPVGAYVIAVVLAVLQWLRTQAVKLTAERGIDTTGTITRAGVDGMINYVQHQRLTVTFTDSKGVQRWLRVGKTGGGYSTGDTVPVRYDPERPWSKRSIIIGS
jgi:ascorbate-specific PTS system EIIC-type component UlaA